MEIDKLFRDLSPRVPYGVIGKVSIDVTTKDIDMEGFHIDEQMDVDVILTDINIDGDIKFMAVHGSSEDLAYTIQEWSEYGVFTYKDFKPYLRPMSSMTEEEKKEYIEYAGYEIEESVNGRHYEYYLKDFCGTPDNPSVNADGVDWLNKKMFDYRGLIPKGIALKAKEGMYNN